MAGVDMNRTPPIGISAGLGIGLLFIFIVKLLSAVVGHGGRGVVRADTIVNLSEIMVAFCFFRMTKRRLQLFSRGAIAATVGLLVGNVVFRIVILVSGRTELQGVALPAYLTQILTLNMIVAVGEAVVTGFVVDYLSRFGPSHRGVIRDVVTMCQDRERISKQRAAL
jgi:cobalt/nickel transport system permease protein